MKRTDVVAFLAGLMFAIGLGIAGMTQPARVMAFLDITGAWDPSLAFVMMGAIAVHLAFALRSKKAAAPLLAPAFVLPTATRVDRSLILGAALFGLGWGAAGFCPGPAVVSVVTLSPTSLVFVGAMLVGMLAYWGLVERKGSAAKKVVVLE